MQIPSLIKDHALIEVYTMHFTLLRDDLSYGPDLVS